MCAKLVALNVCVSIAANEGLKERVPHNREACEHHGRQMAHLEQRWHHQTSESSLNHITNQR